MAVAAKSRCGRGGRSERGHGGGLQRQNVVCLSPDFPLTLLRYIHIIETSKVSGSGGALHGQNVMRLSPEAASNARMSGV